MRLIIFSILFVLLGFASCKKESGCMDPSADNYDAKAEISANNCTYSTEIHFWVQQNGWPAGGGSELYVYSGGALIGTITSTAVYLATPFCSSTGVLVYPITYTSGNSTFTYTVQNASGTTVAGSTVQLTASACVLEQVQ